MRHLAICLLFVISSFFTTRAADGDLFPYPVPPDDMITLEERCNFLVTHFWERCDFKAASSKKDLLNLTFGDWISFMPYATADSVHVAINRVIDRVKKSGPHTLALARMAEAWTYSDTCEIYSEEIYYPFAKAAANHRKISSADRARFENHVNIIDNTRLGDVMKHLEFVKPDGSKGSLNDMRTQIIVLMFNTHDCDECTLSRVRLSADINANALIRAGLLTIACIEPNEPTDDWRATATGMPEEWIIGAAEDADMYFNLRKSTTIYLLDARHKVLAKEFDINGLLSALANLRSNTGI